MTNHIRGFLRQIKHQMLANRDYGQGINIISHHLFASNGVGQASRNVIAAIEATNIPYAICPMGSHRDSPRTELNLAHIPRGTPYKVNLIFANANETEATKQMVKSDVFRGRYNIGYWCWETMNFPKQWTPHFSAYDEIWVMSSFIQQSIGLHAPISVIRMPGAIEPMLSQPATRQDFGLSDNTFVVLFTFDAGSVFERKNPLAVIKAFAAAFSEAECAKNVRLIIKASHLDDYPGEAAVLNTNLKEVNGLLITQHYDREQMYQLLNLADVYVSLHRSEGFGLTMAESMYFGKPVIATCYSGNLDFMTPFNSYLVPAKLTPLERDYFPYEQHDQWADPDINAAASMLRHVYDNRQEANLRGERARQDIRASYNAKMLGNQLATRLNVIYKFRGN